MTPERQKIMDKVIKLLAMAEGTSHAEEADTARNLAAELMAKYDISIMEATKVSSFETVEQELTRLSPIKYDAILINIISRFNGVAYIQSDGWGQFRGKNIFVGTMVDIECNGYMIDILMQQRNYGWKQHLASFKLMTGRKPKDADKNAWFNGFAFGVRAKLVELTALKDSKIVEYGLVPVNKSDLALAEHKKNHNSKTSKGRKTSYNQAGFEAGKNASVHKGIVQDSKTKFIS